MPHLPTCIYILLWRRLKQNHNLICMKRAETLVFLLHGTVHIDPDSNSHMSWAYFLLVVIQSCVHCVQKPLLPHRDFQNLSIKFVILKWVTMEGGRLFNASRKSHCHGKNWRFPSHKPHLWWLCRHIDAISLAEIGKQFLPLASPVFFVVVLFLLPSLSLQPRFP